MTMTVPQRDKVEVEAALFHLMYQFRHIDHKYGLMVSEEINTLYEKNYQSISNSEKKVNRFSVQV